MLLSRSFDRMRDYSIAPAYARHVTPDFVEKYWHKRQLFARKFWLCRLLAKNDNAARVAAEADHADECACMDACRCYTRYFSTFCETLTGEVAGNVDNMRCLRAYVVQSLALACGFDGPFDARVIEHEAWTANAGPRIEKCKAIIKAWYAWSETDPSRLSEVTDETTMARLRALMGKLVQFSIVKKSRHGAGGKKVSMHINLRTYFRIEAEESDLIEDLRCGDYAEQQRMPWRPKL